MEEAMKRKNRFLSFAIALIMILPAMFVLVSCGEKEKTYSVSAVLLNHDEDDYNITLSSSFNSTVDAGGSTTIEVNFVSGYDHVPLVAKLNEKEVQFISIKENFDMHDRVNYAAVASSLQVNVEKKVILLEIELDEEICSILDYFEIFLQRMLMCKRAAEILGLKFKMKANGNKIC